MAFRDVPLGPGISVSAFCSGVFCGTAAASGVSFAGVVGGGGITFPELSSATGSAGVVGEGTTSGGTGDCTALRSGEAGGFRGFVGTAGG